jgi:hypothetical protein
MASVIGGPTRWSSGLALVGFAPLCHPLTANVERLVCGHATVWIQSMALGHSFKFEMREQVIVKYLGALALRLRHDTLQIK